MNTANALYFKTLVQIVGKADNLLASKNIHSS